MTKPPVDYTDLAATYDERYEVHDYGGVEATLEALVQPGMRVLEVGCGTGHWLSAMRAWGCDVFGLDRSPEMLGVAASDGCVNLICASGDVLPIAASSVDAVVAINALHHFPHPEHFALEARRVLKPGGLVATIGLDPSRARDDWYIYDYFEGTRERDVRRYPSTETIAGWWRGSGLEDVSTDVAQHMADEAAARTYLDSGAAAKSSTSQLALLSDTEYDAGIERIWAAVAEAESRGEELMLRGDLILYVTVGRVTT